MTWQSIIDSYRKMPDNRFFDAGYQDAMIGLCEKLKSHPTFEPLKPGTSHHLLTIKTDYRASQQLLAGWFAPDFFHVEYTAFVEDSHLRPTLDKFMGSLIAASQTPLNGQPPEYFQGLIEEGWDAVDTFLRERAASGKDALASVIVKLMPELRTAYELQGIVPQMEHSYSSVGFGIKGSARVVGISHWGGNHVHVTEIANSTSDEVLDLLEIFAARFNDSAGQDT